MQKAESAEKTATPSVGSADGGKHEQSNSKSTSVESQQEQQAVNVNNNSSEKFAAGNANKSAFNFNSH